MKTCPCPQYKEQIKLYCCGDLSAGQAKLLLEHLQTCPNCSDYHQSLLAGDKLLSDWVDALEPWIQSGQDKLLQRLGQEEVYPQPNPQPTGTWLNRQLVGSAIAAGILIAAGFFAGRLSHPAVDTQKLYEQWSRTIQPQMRQEVTDSVVNRLKPQLASLQNNLAEQCAVQINNSALKTLQLVQQADYQLLNDLTEALETVYIQDRQTIASAFYQIEQNRVRDKNNLENRLMAMLTDVEYPRTYRQPGGFTVPPAMETEPTKQVP